MTLCGLHNAILILVEQLDDPKAHPTFKYDDSSDGKGFSHGTLHSTSNICSGLSTSVPARAMAYIQEPDKNREQLHDLPIG